MYWGSATCFEGVVVWFPQYQQKIRDKMKQRGWAISCSLSSKDRLERAAGRVGKSADKETRPDRRSIGPNSITAFSFNGSTILDAFADILPGRFPTAHRTRTVVY